MNQIEPKSGPTYEESARGVMRTYTGGKMSLLAPNVDDVRIEDIAHGLSQLCRFTGQCNELYTVAEHSVRVAKDAKERHGLNPHGVLAALLHDAAEAYLGDVARPVKEAMRYISQDSGQSAYDVLEGRMERVIDQCFGIERHADLRAAIKESDNHVYCEEVEQYMNLTSSQPMTPNEAADAFIEMFSNLEEEIQGA